MRLLLIWSGDRSKEVARFLKEWLSIVFHNVEPWMSEVDIEAGARWSEVTKDQLARTRFGIICLTRDNLFEQWILYESGAIAHAIRDSRVCPYLIDLEPEDLPKGPLKQFQVKRANREETYELLLSINKALGDRSLPVEILNKTFKVWWPDLEECLNSVRETGVTEEGKMGIDSVIDEIIEKLREVKRFIEQRSRCPDITIQNIDEILRNVWGDPLDTIFTSNVESMEPGELEKRIIYCRGYLSGDP